MIPKRKNPSGVNQTGLMLSENATRYSKSCNNNHFPAWVPDLVCRAQAWGRNLPSPEAA